MQVLKTLHVFGAIFLLGGVTTHVLLRPMVPRAAEPVRLALLRLAWRVQLAMVYVGSALVVITGVLLWIGHFKLLTGWLLLGALLFVAAMGLDGAFLARTIRPARRSRAGGAFEDAAYAESSSTLAAAAMTVQLVAWFLLVVVAFLMVAQPF